MATDPRRRLPADFIAKVEAIAAGAVPAPAKPAATVVLLREATDGAGPGIELCLLRRVRTMAFAAGMHVFPGGGVDAADAEGRDGDWIGPSPQWWSTPLSAEPSLARALVCAAVRETFEESAVLLAGADQESIVDTAADPSWEDDRQALLAHAVSLSEILHRRGLRLRADLLRPWAHWITPEVEPKRYDTRFFVAALPPGRATRHVGGEADRTVWLRPADALERAEAGQLAMLPPTASTISDLRPHTTVDAVLEAAHKREIRPVLPRVAVVGGRAELLLPHEPGYHAASAVIR